MAGLIVRHMTGAGSVEDHVRVANDTPVDTGRAAIFQALQPVDS